METIHGTRKPHCYGYTKPTSKCKMKVINTWKPFSISNIQHRNSCIKDKKKREYIFVGGKWKPWSQIVFMIIAERILLKPCIGMVFSAVSSKKTMFPSINWNQLVVQISYRWLSPLNPPNELRLRVWFYTGGLYIMDFFLPSNSHC